MKPLRRKKTYEVTQDPTTGRVQILNLVEEEDILSDQGSVDSVTMNKKCFLNCGCDAPASGRCHECGAISCESCHGRCHNCQKPICLEHSNFLQVGGENRVRLCSNCCDTITRKQRLTKVGHFFLSLLFEEKKND